MELLCLTRRAFAWQLVSNIKWVCRYIETRARDSVLLAPSARDKWREEPPLPAGIYSAAFSNMLPRHREVLGVPLARAMSPAPAPVAASVAPGTRNGAGGVAPDSQSIGPHLPPPRLAGRRASERPGMLSHLRQVSARARFGVTCSSSSRVAWPSSGSSPSTGLGPHCRSTRAAVGAT